MSVRSKLSFQQCFCPIYFINFNNRLMQDQTTIASRIKGCVNSISERVGRQNFGLILMGLSQLLWPISFIYPSEKKMNPIETNLVRAAVGVISHYFILKWFGLSYDIKSKSNLRYILIRNFIVCMHLFGLAGILYVLPFSVVFTINNSCALFVFIIDYYLYKIYGVIWGFVGVLLTVNGEFFMNLFYPELEKQTDFKNYVTDDPYLKLLAGLGFILINCGRAYAMCIYKSIKGVNGVQMSYHLGISQIIACGIAYIQLVQKQSSLSDMLWCSIYSGIPQNIVQIFFASAIMISKNTGITNLMCFISIAISYFISLVRYNEALNGICLLGVVLISYGIIRTLSTRQQHQK